MAFTAVEARVQLGEVFEQTEATAPPPKPKRRPWLLWLLLLIVIAGVPLLHGPGIEQIPAQTALVVTNDTGLALFGPPARVARFRPGLAFWLPVAQHAHRVSLRRRRTDGVDVDLRTRDGVPLELLGASASFQVRPTDAAKVFLHSGARAEDWSRLVRAETALAWATLVQERELADLLSTPPRSLLLPIKRRLETRLDALGFELLEVYPPRWRPPATLRAAVHAVEAARTARDAAAKASADAVQAAAAADRTVAQRQATEDAAHAAILAAELEAARMESAALLAAARDAAVTRRDAAQTERTALFTRAKVIEAVAPSDAEGLAARVNAVAAHGERLLDQAILETVLPQLRQTPASAEAP